MYNRGLTPQRITGKSVNSLDRALDRVSRGERVVLRRGTKPVAAVVPIEDLTSGRRGSLTK
jgi:antitoxin (DNA-binding transcriptional repressor) of toxin-antitoxin stability system